MNDRDRAFHLLRRIDREGAYASLLLQHETGFVRTLVLGVLRWRLRLDDAIEQLADRRIAKLDPNVVVILRMGVFQLMFTGVAPYAAVSESVDLAHRYAKRARGFVNAILRREMPEPRDVPARTSHPEWILRRWEKQYGAERAVRIAEANQQLSYPDVFGGSTGTPSELVEGMFKLSGSSADVQGHAMDEGSAVIADLAAATSKDILDLAAAPGGKTIVMSARGARVVSNDISITRLHRLQSPRRVISDGRVPPFRRKFETVLIDAPCSATGTVRKNPELKWRLHESDIARFAQLQRELLMSALQLATDSVVYSTCSLEPEENDEVVRNVLASQKDFERVDAGFFANAEVRKWVEDGVLRLTPESGADGFTAFVLQRIASS